MKFVRPLIVFGLLLGLLGAVWFWWNQPRKVDMADYVPADSFVYLEFNSLTDVAKAFEQNDTWKAVAPIVGTKVTEENRWLAAAARAGIAPAGGVIFSRAQVALIVVGMNTTEQDDTLRVRPEAALLVETHTSKWRVKPAAVDAVKRLATFVYGQSACTERTGDADYVECSAAGTDRKIVAAIDGSLVIVSNTEKAVRSCLEVKRGLRPSLHTDGEMLRVRSRLAADKALGFGYISSANSARLFSWAAPLLMGRAPGNSQLEQVLAGSAAKILRGIAWTSTPSLGGIEDRFLFSLEPAVVSRLEPAFDTAAPDNNFWKLVPGTFQSLTIYRSQDPTAAWIALDSAVALKLDALSAVVFGSLLKSGLAVYGIEDPKELLASLTAPLLTLKPSPSAAGSVLLARVNDPERLRRTLTQQVFKGGKGQILDGVQLEPNGEKEFTALFIDGYLLVGKSEYIRPCVMALRDNQVLTEGKLDRITHFAPQSSSAIVTFANDDARLSNFVSVVSLLKGASLTQDQLAGLERAIKKSHYSATETSLNSMGLERKTRSAFGQFSTLLSLLQPDSSSAPLR